MSEPAWVALGAQQVDYEGAYAAGTQYQPGDVVRYQGVDYICVNPALGQTPAATAIPATPPVIPLVTALPASPFDGQEVILTDSLTVPTYFWRMRYHGAGWTYPWIFVGGSPLTAYDATDVGVVASFAVAGPTLTLPRAGIWDLTFSATCYSGAAQNHYYRLHTYPGNAQVGNAREHLQDTQSGNQRWSIAYGDRITIATAPGAVGVAARCSAGGNATWQQRKLELRPVRLV